MTKTSFFLPQLSPLSLLVGRGKRFTEKLSKIKEQSEKKNNKKKKHSNFDLNTHVPTRCTSVFMFTSVPLPGQGVSVQGSITFANTLSSTSSFLLFHHSRTILLYCRATVALGR